MRRKGPRLFGKCVFNALFYRAHQKQPQISHKIHINVREVKLGALYKNVWDRAADAKLQMCCDWVAVAVSYS